MGVANFLVCFNENKKQRDLYLLNSLASHSSDCLNILINNIIIFSSEDDARYLIKDFAENYPSLYLKNKHISDKYFNFKFDDNFYLLYDVFNSYKNNDKFIHYILNDPSSLFDKNKPLEIKILEVDLLNEKSEPQYLKNVRYDLLDLVSISIIEDDKVFFNKVIEYAAKKDINLFDFLSNNKINDISVSKNNFIKIFTENFSNKNNCVIKELKQILNNNWPIIIYNCLRFNKNYIKFNNDDFINFIENTPIVYISNNLETFISTSEQYKIFNDFLEKEEKYFISKNDNEALKLISMAKQLSDLNSNICENQKFLKDHFNIDDDLFQTGDINLLDKINNKINNLNNIIVDASINKKNNLEFDNFWEDVFYKEPISFKLKSLDVKSEEFNLMYKKFKNNINKKKNDKILKHINTIYLKNKK